MVRIVEAITALILTRRRSQSTSEQGAGHHSISLKSVHTDYDPFLCDENDQYFQRDRDKLDQWAEDQVLSAEKQLEDTKFLIRDTKRKSRMAQTPEEQNQSQEEIKKLERLQRRQRQEIFDVQDEIESRRDQLIDVLERRMKQKIQVKRLFRIRWQLA